MGTSKGEKCIIRYIGKVNHQNIEMYGIEYIDGTLGQHNGEYKGKKYFIGQENRCSFIKYSKIRGKTKYYQNEPRVNPNRSSPRKYKKSPNKIHSKNIFLEQYNNKLKKKRVSVSRSMSKRKSLPIKTKQNKTSNTQKLARRASDGNKTKNKYLIHLDELTKKKRASHSKSLRKPKAKKHAKCATKTPKMHKTSNKQRATSMHHMLKGGVTRSCQKRQSLKVLKDERIRSKSIGNVKECTIYNNECIHFSQMDSIKTDEDVSESPSFRRKMAFGQNILSKDSLSEYRIKHNVLIGDIYINHRYQLKDGQYGICLYVGSLHWIDDNVYNEYIGIALEKPEGKHDGEVKGKRYFQCQCRCGIFVKRNKLKRDCGPVDASLIERITTKNKKKMCGLLYEHDSDISDLSGDDEMNYLSISRLAQIESDDAHSGHSDFNDDDIEESASSYIDLFNGSMSTDIDNDINDIVITPKQWESEKCKKRKKKKKKVSKKRLSSFGSLKMRERIKKFENENKVTSKTPKVRRKNKKKLKAKKR